MPVASVGCVVSGLGFPTLIGAPQGFRVTQFIEGDLCAKARVEKSTMKGFSLVGGVGDGGDPPNSCQQGPHGLCESPTPRREL